MESLSGLGDRQAYLPIFERVATGGDSCDCPEGDEAVSWDSVESVSGLVHGTGSWEACARPTRR